MKAHALFVALVAEKKQKLFAWNDCETDEESASRGKGHERSFGRADP
jgi:hypothetical protein